MWRPLVSHNLFSWSGRSSSCRNECPVDICRHQLQSHNIVKAASFRLRLECSHYLFSQPVTRQLSSAYMCLTSVFGMGTGGPTWQSIRTHLRKRSSPSYIKQCSRAFCYQLFIAYLLGDPYRIRTDVNGVRGRCLNHLTNGPLVQLQGLEPGTHWLRVSCSTNWAKAASLSVQADTPWKLNIKLLLLATRIWSTLSLRFGQAFGLLVSVSLMCYHTYTPDLSTT